MPDFKPTSPAYEGDDDERPASAASDMEFVEAEQRDFRKDPYAAFRFRNFVLYAIGWVINVVGDQIMEVAIGWDIYKRTHNPMSLGWVGLVSAAPVMLLALPAGHLADRFDRRKIVLVAQACRAMCVVALGLLSFKSQTLGLTQHQAIAYMYVLLAVIAICKALGWPARSAMLPSLVPDEVFPNAVNWNSSGFQMSVMVGAAIGGPIVGWNVPLAYLIAAICQILFALSMIPLKPRKDVARKEPPSLKSVVAGVNFVFEKKIILATITLDLFAVLLGGATYLLPIFASDLLKVGAIGFGWLRAAPALGAIVMGMVVAHLPPMKRAGLAMLWAVAGFGIATIIFGLSRSLWLSLVALFLVGAFDNISVLVRHTLVQVLTPDAMRGRVSAVNNIFIGASNELGGFESGVTAKFFGPIASVVFGGIGTILVVAAVAWTWPQVRAFGSLVDAKPEE